MLDAEQTNLSEKPEISRNSHSTAVAFACQVRVEVCAVGDEEGVPGAFADVVDGEERSTAGLAYPPLSASPHSQHSEGPAVSQGLISHFEHHSFVD